MIASVTLAVQANAHPKSADPAADHLHRQTMKTRQQQSPTAITSPRIGPKINSTKDGSVAYIPYSRIAAKNSGIQRDWTSSAPPASANIAAPNPMATRFRSRHFVSVHNRNHRTNRPDSLGLIVDKARSTPHTNNEFAAAAAAASASSSATNAAKFCM